MTTKKSHKKRSTKKSHTKRSLKHSHKKHSSTHETSIPKKIKYFYDITVKHLAKEHQDALQMDTTKSILVGTASQDELQKMPWMIGVTVNWSLVPGPYSFVIQFSHAKDGIQKRLSIGNHDTFLLRPFTLNRVIKSHQRRSK